jgi:hypothetical protein
MSDGREYTRQGDTLLRRGDPGCQDWVVELLLLYLALRQIFGLHVSKVSVMADLSDSSDGGRGGEGVGGERRKMERPKRPI